MTDYRQLLACSDGELGQVDPLLMNLLVAKSIPRRLSEYCLRLMGFE